MPVTNLATIGPKLRSGKEVIVSNRLSPSADTATAPALEKFEQAASEGAQIHVSRDGSQWRVLGQGTTPSQRSVAWLEPGQESDTTSVFVEALGQSFSSGIQSAVVRELGLAPAPNKPLSSRTVQQAIEMAQTAQKSLDGVDFMTQLQFSAKANSAGFVDACRASGVEAGQVSPAQRQEIDAAMQQRFQNAAQHGESPVSMSTARSLPCTR